MQRALDDRLDLSEAIEAVGRMIAGYPQSKDAAKSYIGAISSLLMKYPRMVATACADPFAGVVTTTKFLPTPYDIISFCEKKVAVILHDAERELRIEKQFADREQPYRSPLDEARRKQIADAWLDRTDPLAKELGLKPMIVTDEDREALAEDARKAGAKISGMKLKPETLEVLRAQDATSKHLTDEP